MLVMHLWKRISAIEQQFAEKSTYYMQLILQCENIFYKFFISFNHVFYILIL